VIATGSPCRRSRTLNPRSRCGSNHCSACPLFAIGRMEEARRPLKYSSDIIGVEDDDDAAARKRQFHRAGAEFGT
jgi:hypothetical protein